jgi:secreted trypsin-like serine protease
MRRRGVQEMHHSVLWKYRRYKREAKEKGRMSRAKLVVTVAMLAVMLAGAGSAAFAAQQPDQQPPGQQQPGQQQEPPGPGIVGGSNVPDSSKYPFVAALLDERKTGNALTQHFCGGSLIDSDNVLTAAHCVDGIFPTNLSVVVGRAQLSSNQGELREATRIYIPDGFNSNGPSKNDVAVIRLKSAVMGITPVLIPPSTDNWYEQVGKAQTIAGWGRTMSGGTRPDQLQEAKLTVVSDEVAAKSYPSHYIPELMIAAGGNGKDTCQGDSGGPMFARPLSLGKPPAGAPPRPYSQYGITSFGRGCGGSDPGVYTEVNAPFIREFITTSMNK